jgi:hypothetical protein
VGRVDGVADPAFDFRPEDKRMQEVASGDRLRFGDRENRGRDGAGRMDDRLQVCVVEIKDVRADAVDERRVQDVEALASSEEAGLARP